MKNLRGFFSWIKEFHAKGAHPLALWSNYPDKKASTMKTVKLSLILLTVAILSACAGSETAAPTPTPVDVSALQTAAVETIVAGITRTAAAQPTATGTPTLLPPTPTETVTPTAALSATQQLCDNSVFISDASVPDGTRMTAGQAFVKTWKVKNTGTCAWKTNYTLIHAYGEKLGGLTSALAAEVLPNSEVEISVNLKAPDKPGNYSGYWRLANNNGVPFGQVLTVIISIP
jgi:hypothetical protein